MGLSENQKYIFECFEVGEYIKHNDIKPVFKTNGEVRKHITDFLNNFEEYLEAYPYENEEERWDLDMDFHTGLEPDDAKLHLLRQFVREMGYYDNKTYINIAKDCMKQYFYSCAYYDKDEDYVISDDLIDCESVKKPEQPPYNPNLFIYSF